MVLPKSTNMRKYITIGLIAGLSAFSAALLSIGAFFGLVIRASSFAAAARCLLVVAMLS